MKRKNYISVIFSMMLGVVALMLIFCFSPAAEAAGDVVPVDTDITADTTWTSGNTYIICNTGSGNPKIHNGATLTIESGATVKLGTGTYTSGGGTSYAVASGMKIEGNIQANNATFTLWENSSDSYWTILEMLNGSAGTFTNCTFEKGGRGATSYAMIQAVEGDVTLSFTGCTFQDAGYYDSEQRGGIFYQNNGTSGGVSITNSTFSIYRSTGNFNVSVSGCVFENIAANAKDWTTVWLGGGKNVSLADCTFRYNGGDPTAAKTSGYTADIYAYDANTDNAPENLSITDCTFNGEYEAGTAGRDRYPLAVNPGLSLNNGINNPNNTIENYTNAKIAVVSKTVSGKDAVFGKMGMPYLISGTPTYNDTATLTVKPGVEVRFGPSGYLVMKGGLTAEGSSAEHITFRSDAEFTAQNDATGKNGYIQLRYLEGANISNSFEFCDFRHMSVGILADAPSTYSGTPQLSVKNCTFNLMDGSAVRIDEDEGKFTRDNAVIDNCVITNSRNYGIYLESGSHTTSPAIKNCRILNCGKAGIFLWRSGALIKNTILAGNGCYKNAPGDNAWDGSGIVSRYDQGVEAENCTVYGSGQYGVYTYELTTNSAGKIKVKNSIIWNNKNTAGTPYGIRANSSSSITYSNINGTDNGGVSRGTGCISSDPLFADAAAGDFHLKSTAGRWDGSSWVADAESSPCIDTGDPASSYANEPANNGSRINMGAYGNTAAASKTAGALTTYTVSFDSQGGSAVAAITGLVSGSTISKPAAPTKANWAFGGWYKEAGCSNAWNFDSDTVTGDTTLYARWVTPSYAASVSPSGNQVFTALTAGYSGGSQQEITFTISNTGTCVLSNLAVALSGGGASSFEYTALSETEITPDTHPGPHAAYTAIKAKNGLAEGTYTETVRITADSMTDITFTVTQKVNAASAGNNSGGGSGSASGTAGNVSGTTSLTPEQRQEMLQSNQTLQIENGQLELTIDPGVLPDINEGTIKIQTSVITDTNDLNSFFALYSEQRGIMKAYDIVFTRENNGQATSISQLGGEITLQFNFNEEELKELDPSTLVVYKQGEDGGITELGGVFDYGSNSLTVSTSHLCRFFIMGRQGIPAERIAGNNRYATAASLSAKGWSTSDTVILASGENYPDALAGTVLAGSCDAPVLLTAGQALNPETAAEIKRLQAKTVYILGGDLAISPAVEQQLAKEYKVTRIVGGDRYATAIEIGNIIKQKTNSVDTVVLATGQNFADALAVAPFAGDKKLPIVFADQNTLSERTRQALRDWGVKKVIIAGGKGVVSQETEDILQKEMGLAVTRLQGENRYLTCLAIVRYFSSNPAEGGGEKYEKAALATGENYPDALAGAALAAKEQIPVLMTKKTSAEAEIVEYLKKLELKKLFVFGGKNAIEDRVKNEIGLK